jgi:hypothetical protein
MTSRFAEHDDQGRLLDDDSGKFICPMNEYRPEHSNPPKLPMPLILAVEVTDGVQLTPDGSWESAYHFAIAEVRGMHSGADDVIAIESDFIVQMRTFNGDDKSDHAWGDLYYVGLPVNFGREVLMKHA